MAPKFASRSSLDHYKRFSIPPIEEFRARSIINFTHGYASPELLPSQELTEAWNKVMAESRDIALQYGPAQGVDPLRQSLLKYLESDFQIAADPENLSIITGSKQGLDLLCKAFIEPGDRVIVTSPTYGTGLKILKTHEVDFLEVPVDADGMVVSELRRSLEALDRDGESLPKLAFTVPEFHNPTGVSMPQERRRELLELAEEYGFVIAEDDPYRKLRFEGDEGRPLKSLDENGSVVYLGTYSKIICPGIRVGWMVADSEIIERTLPLKEDGGTSALCQMLVRELHDRGYLSERAETYAEHLAQHRDATVHSVNEHLQDARIVEIPEGGYYIWIEFPEDVNTSELLEYARDENVLYLPGEAFTPSDGNRNFLRVSWAYEDVDNIEEGIKRLEKAYRRYTQEST